MRIGILGYGNLGRGVEAAIAQNSDAELVAVFSRRNPEGLKTESGAKVVSADDILNYRDEIDVLIICGGSATDLPEMTPRFAKHFNLIDSFDTHAKIQEHFENTDRAAREGGRLSLISAGWDPGLFSITRAYFSSFLPKGADYTFWGRGISQGHSDAIRRIDGVLDARQYTVPKKEALDAVRSGQSPALATADKHTRECYVVAEAGADLDLIEKTIKEMPNYFADYETTVNFISKEELAASHSGMPHGGSVIRNGFSGIAGQSSHTLELSIRLDSNPEFTGSILVAYARAIDRMAKAGEVGCRTVLDIPPAMLSPMSGEELRKKMI